MLKLRAALLALAVTSSIAVQAEPLVLAPGKSVTVFDAADTWIRVVITAPADAPLDLTALFASVGPKEGVQSLATRSQVREAGAIVRNADGSLALTFVEAEIAGDLRSIDGGFFAFAEGKYSYYEEAPSGGTRTEGISYGAHLVRDHVPLPATAIGGLPKAATGAVVPTGLPAMPALPTGGATISGGTISIGTTQPILNWGSFNIGGSALGVTGVTTGGTVQLNSLPGSGQVQINGTLTPTGNIGAPAITVH